jgi:glutathione peroxidase
MSTLQDVELKTITGERQHLTDYAGKTLLIVNVASKCGFTPQYQGLEDLYRTYKDRGLVVMGFPCDQFGHQEPGSDAEIQSFCTRTYGVSFPMFSKIEVNGPGAHPLYRHLIEADPGPNANQVIEWNFAKFLVDSHGQVVRRYAPKDRPEKLAGDIEPLLMA